MHNLLNAPHCKSRSGYQLLFREESDDGLYPLRSRLLFSLSSLRPTAPKPRSVPNLCESKYIWALLRPDRPSHSSFLVLLDFAPQSVLKIEHLATTSRKRKENLTTWQIHHQFIHISLNCHIIGYELKYINIHKYFCFRFTTPLIFTHSCQWQAEARS